MPKDYELIDFEILREFLEDSNDANLLIKHLLYKNLYMSIYDYVLCELREDSQYDEFVKVAFKAYKMQDKLNRILKFTEGKYDAFLMRCVIGTIWDRFGSVPAMQNADKNQFMYEMITLNNRFNAECTDDMIVFNKFYPEDVFGTSYKKKL